MTVGEAWVWLAVSVGLPVAALLLVLVAGRLAGGLHMTTRVFAAAHSLTLGVGSTTIVGAAYQMSSALLGARLWGERIIPWQLGIYLAGAGSLVAGFWYGSFVLLAWGGSLVAAAAWVYVAIMLRTAGRLRRRTGPPASRQGRPQWVHALAMALATVNFGLVTTWGLVLALSMRYPLWPGLWAGHRGLVVHLALGLGGWFALMVVGVSYRLVPIVHGARIASQPRGLAVVALVTGAVLLAVTGALGRHGWALRLAAALIAPAGALYVWELARLLQHRRRRAPDLNVSHWWAVMGYTLVLAAMGLGWAAGLVGPEHGERLGVLAAVLFLAGWVVQAILGQLYKVTPFLMWYYRAFIPDVLQISRLPDLYAPRPGRLAFWLTNAGVVLMGYGIARADGGWATAGAVLLAAGCGLVAWMLGYSWIPGVVAGRLPFRWRHTEGASA
ncbi:MAG: hypothetical protein IMX02_07265 [Limnochordaceae bacterium]|nr:hypothetical protein [Limnochordaceae bacterium]